MSKDSDDTMRYLNGSFLNLRKGMGLTIFDLKGRPVKNVLLQMMVQWTTDEKGVEIELKEGGKKIFLKTGEGDPICARLNLAEKEHNARSAA